MVLYLSDVHTNKIDNNRFMEKKKRIKSNSPEEEFLRGKGFMSVNSVSFGGLFPLEDRSATGGF